MSGFDVKNHRVIAPGDLMDPPIGVPPPKKLDGLVDSAVVDWAVAPKTGSRKVPSWQRLKGSLYQYYPRKTVDFFDTEGNTGMLIARELSEHAVILINGKHHSAKEAMMPYLVHRLAEECRESNWVPEDSYVDDNMPRKMRDDDFSSTPRPGKESFFSSNRLSAMFSTKMMIICPTANAAIHRGHEYRKEFPELRFNVYLNHSDLAPDQFNEKKKREWVYSNARVNGVAMHTENIHGIIVDMATANELLERGGFFGSIVVENCESYTVYPQLRTLVANALSKMAAGGGAESLHVTERKAEQDQSHHLIEPRHLGRLILLSSDSDWKDEYFARITAAMEYQAYYSHVTVTMPDVETFMPAVHAYKTGGAMHLEPASHKDLLKTLNGEPHTSNLLNAAREKIQKKFPFLGTHDTDFVARERLDGQSLPGAAPKTPAEQLESPFPDPEFGRIMLVHALDKALEHCIHRKNVDQIDPSAREDDCMDSTLYSAQAFTKRLSTVVLFVPSKEQVSGVCGVVKDLDGFNIAAPQFRKLGGENICGKHGKKKRWMDYDEAYTTAKMSFTWKVERQVAMGEDTPVVKDAIYSNEQGGSCHRGRLIVTTFDAATGMDLDGVDCVVISGYRSSPGRYLSHGLNGPRREFLDGHTVKLLLDRLARKNRTDPKRVFVYGGSESQFARQFDMDDRWASSQAGYGVTEYLLEYAHPGFTADNRRLIDDHLEEKKRKAFHEDVINTGMANEFRFMGNEEPPRGVTAIMDEETRKLIGLFPEVDPRWARLVILAVRMGLASHAVALLALVMIDGRLFQQAANTDAATLAYSCPAVDIFIAAFRHIRHGRVFDEDLYCKYESEAVALADLFASFITGSYWSHDSREFKYQDYVGSRPDERHTHISKANFWSCDWSTVPGVLESDRAFKELRERCTYAGRVDYRDLYMAFIKDEGREAFHQICHRINLVLIRGGFIVESHHSFLHKNYNRYRFCEGSEYLNMDGRSLLAGLIAMCFSNVASYNRRTDKFASMGPSPCGGRWPRRYEVYDSWAETELIVHGYSVIIPEEQHGEDREYFIMYAPSDGEISGTRAKGHPRFHATVHQVTAGQLAALGNIHSPCARKEGMSPTISPRIILPLTGSPNIMAKKMAFEIEVDGGVCGGEASEHLAKKIMSIRAFLKTALNQALCPNTKSMEQYEKLIIATWDAFKSPRV